MKLDLKLFYRTFPCYDDYKIPMWDEFIKTKKNITQKIVVPGYTRNDFVLFCKDKELFLNINQGKRQLTYSILGGPEADIYSGIKASKEYKNGVLTIKIPKYLELSI